MRIAFIGNSNLLSLTSIVGFYGDFEFQVFPIGVTSSKDEIIVSLADFKPKLLILLDPIENLSLLENVARALTVPFLIYLSCNIEKSNQSSLQLKSHLEQLQSHQDSKFGPVIICETEELRRNYTSNNSCWSIQSIPLADNRYIHFQREIELASTLFLVDESTDKKYRKIITKLGSNHFMPISGVIINPFMQTKMSNFNVVVNTSSEYHGIHSRIAMLTMARNQLYIGNPIQNNLTIFPGCEYVLLEELDDNFDRLNKHPFRYSWIKERGHLQSERLKASLVWPRIINSLLAQKI